jgi:ribose-phosphate pyrophosphokinase
VSKANYIIVTEDSFESFKYPGGEIQVRLLPETIEQLKSAGEVDILFRIKSSDDVMKLMLLEDAIDSCTPHIGSLSKGVILPYLPYSRADRRFVEGDCLGKSVFLQVIGSGWKNIITLDCHSDKNSYGIQDISVDNLVRDLLATIETETGEEINILFPDEGAKNRYSKIGEGYSVHFCQKKRDPVTGKFLGFEVPEFDKTKTTIIVDDICDGGGTFLGIAQLLSAPKLRLYVTHGIFSKGFDELSKYFEKIYTTNSFSEHYDNPIVECLDIMRRF